MAANSNLNVQGMGYIYWPVKSADLHGQGTERPLIEQFVETLRRLPGVRADLDLQADPKGMDRGIDAKIDLRVAGRSLTLLVEAKTALYPRDVHRVLWQLKDSAHPSTKPSKNPPTLPVLIAESLSPGSKELLRDEGVAYFDSGGSLYLQAEGLYVYVEKPPSKAHARSVRSLFSGRRSQVVHALLLRPAEWTGVGAVADRAEVSAATASQVLTELDRLDWLETRGRGPNKERRLRAPAALLDAWAKHLAATPSRPPMRRYFVPALRGDALIGRLDQVFASHGVEYAITHEAAGQRYAPFLSSVPQVHCRLPLPRLAATLAIRDLGARPVDEGANLAVIEAQASGEILFRERVRGAWLASPVQVYLDLQQGVGRSKELAEHLRREKIGF